MTYINHTVDESNLKQGDDTLPPGNYAVEVIKCDTAKTRDDDTMIVVSLKVVEGSQKDSQLTDRFNYFHKKEQTQRIARAQFDRMLHAMGVAQCNDTSELVGKKFGIAVQNVEEKWLDQKTGEERSAIKNKIKKYLKIDAPVQAAPEAATEQTGTPWN
jgi:hypothetical protein